MNRTEFEDVVRTIGQVPGAYVPNSNTVLENLSNAGVDLRELDVRARTPEQIDEVVIKLGEAGLLYDHSREFGEQIESSEGPVLRRHGFITYRNISSDILPHPEEEMYFEDLRSPAPAEV